MIDFSKCSFSDIPYQMTYREFEEAKIKWGEYSCSLPTGTPAGKKWLCRRPYDAPEEKATWYIGQYGEAREGYVPITWMRIEIDFSGHYLERLGSRQMP